MLTGMKNGKFLIKEWEVFEVEFNQWRKIQLFALKEKVSLINEILLFVKYDFLERYLMIFNDNELKISRWFAQKSSEL